MQKYKDIWNGNNDIKGRKLQKQKRHNRQNRRQELPLNTIPLLIMMLCLQRGKTVTTITLTTFCIITKPSQPSNKQQI